MISDTYTLTDCDLYTTCEPCPMCLGAIYWSRVKAVYYGATRDDAANFGFRDSLLYEEVKLDIEDANRKIPLIEESRVAALQVFENWEAKGEKITH